MRLSQRINAERVVLLGWSRAILLQLAHPLLAAAVATHSTFRGGRLTAARRLHQTVRAMLDLTFGDQETYRRTIDAIRSIHDRVNGSLAEAVGPFPAGTHYSAHDPDLLLWVHATLIESVVLAHDTFVRPLTADERDTYCDEAAPVAIDLGARPADVPRTWAALVAYLASVDRSGVLVVSADARDLAEAVLSPPLEAAVWPAAWLNRRFTIATLPEDVRRQYGFDETARQAARLRTAARLVRLVRHVTPGWLARWRTRVRSGSSKTDTRRTS